MVNTHVSSLVNPFDTKNGQPKWPDGLATYSIGRRHQLTSEIALDDFYILLFPGAINWCIAFKPFTNLVQDYIGGNRVPRIDCHIHANHTANISVNYEYNHYTVLDPSNGATQVINEQINHAWNDITSPWVDHDIESTAQNLRAQRRLHEYQLHVPHDAFSAWRNVATAVHVQVINTTDSNEGWFRAIRLPRKRESRSMFDILMGPGSVYGNGNHIMSTPHFHTGGLHPSIYFLEEIDKLFTTNPTMCCGELQDIHNAVFQLNEVKERNEFTPLKTETVYTYLKRRQIYKRDSPLDLFREYEMFAVQEAYDLHHLRGASRPEKAFWPAAQQTSLQGFLSENKDIILIHIKGGPRTKVLLHSVNNQEFLTPDNSQLSQYVTPCDYDKQGLSNYNRNRSDYHKYPFHYLTNLEATEKALPGPYYASEQKHYFG